jgi:hypothetical protein
MLVAIATVNDVALSDISMSDHKSAEGERFVTI